MLACFAVQHRERGANLDLIVCTRTKKGPDYPVLGLCPPEEVVEDGEERDRMDGDIRWWAAARSLENETHMDKM